MHNLAPLGRLKGRRVAPVAASALLAAAFAAPAAKADPSPIAVDAAQDSVLVTGLPFGQTTLQLTRPDLKTGTPVVIGQVQGLALPGLPFGANTTAPSLFNPTGDCWQKGSLSPANNLGLTPDILPGDTATVVGGPSYTVPADAATSNGAPGGPIAGCETLSAYDKNAVTAASFASPGGALAVSGQAQPGTAGVTTIATDAKGTSTAPVTATVAPDGSYTATIPAGSLAALANGPVTVSGDYTVPDVASGKPADIGGVTLSADKETPAPKPATPAPKAPAPAAKVALSGLHARSAITAKSVKAGKLRVSFVVPTGAQFVRVRLWRTGDTAALNVFPAAKAGTRQKVAVTGVKAGALKKGAYTLTVSASPVRTMFVGASLRSLVHVR